MTLFDIENQSKRFYPVLALDTFFSRSLRAHLIKILLVVLAFSGAVTILACIPYIYTLLITYASGFEDILALFEGTFFIVLAFFLPLFSIHTFSNSLYYSGFDKVLTEHTEKGKSRVSFSVAALCFGMDAQDVTRSFLQFSYGHLILTRAGLEPNEIELFLKNRASPLPAEKLLIDLSREEGVVHLSDIALAIFHQDKEFSDFLFHRGIQEKNFADASLWVARDIARFKKYSRWWSRDRLGRVEGIAKDWSYGTAFRLRRYSIELTALEFAPLSTKPKYIQDDVERLEATLARTRVANAMLVGVTGGSRNDVLRGFSSLVQEGKAFPSLEHKKIYLFDSQRLISEAGNKAKLESEFTKLLDEALDAQNVIIVIDEFASFIESATKVGVSVESILTPYLRSPKIQFICLSNPEMYHQYIEPNAGLKEHFETVLLKEGEDLDIIQTLQDEASTLEAQLGVIIPQSTLTLVAESADRYIVDGIMPDKAISLLHEVATKSAQEKRPHVGRGEVLALIRTKTGIPTGAVSDEERDKLMKLEEVLHQRVIGQDEAIMAIAGAMRRARAGVTNPNRPIGSFLFMGPTGVGKTETTKALAEAFFGDEDKILRFDMSEYKAHDALSKLIGAFGSSAPGVLTTMLREKPYGVLLLDEFEKTTKDVMDLFLQILDEGMFADMRGKKVNARNLIIIATSNAGSDLIYATVKQGENLAAKKDTIIDSVIAQGVFKPELMNRFDGVILFQPIDDVRLREIAKLMLERFRSRLKSRSIDLVVTDELINFLMRYGADPKFGARPMNRAIQDVVEQIIADKIIKGEVGQGQKIELTKDDLARKSLTPPPPVVG